MFLDASSLIGDELDGYRIDAELGSGGMGMVFRAENLSLKRIVALKLIAPRLARDSSFLRRFRSEAQALARLHHPHIVFVYSLGESELGPYLAMEYVEGGTLDDMLRREGALATDRGVHLFKQMLLAFQKIRASEAQKRTRWNQFLDQFSILDSPAAARMRNRAQSYLRYLPILDGTVYNDHQHGYHFVPVPAGTFTTEIDAANESAVRRVTISRPFLLEQYEMTQDQWKALMGDNPSFLGGPAYPVENVTWNDVQDFIERLNESPSGACTYRLPSEAEWEHAARFDSARGLTQHPETVAWYHANANGKTHVVGRKAPNMLGLHDLFGNVAEWVQDVYAPLEAGTFTDPVHHANGRRHVFRGGAYMYPLKNVRADARSSAPASQKGPTLGFRLVCEMEELGR